ncbi:hypothetical protein HY440_01175 [Candidatus Microgenomates bacterium]|nr:hypothetical protein [Candidatus Microgenomates bacterium]
MSITTVDKAIKQAYYKLAYGKTILIRDIPKVFSFARGAIERGATVDQAVRAAVLMYCRKE